MGCGCRRRRFRVRQSKAAKSAVGRVPETPVGREDRCAICVFGGNIGPRGVVRCRPVETLAVRGAEFGAGVGWVRGISLRFALQSLRASGIGRAKQVTVGSCTTFEKFQSIVIFQPSARGRCRQRRCEQNGGRRVSIEDRKLPSGKVCSRRMDEFVLPLLHPPIWEVYTCTVFRLLDMTKLRLLELKLNFAVF